MPIVDRKPNWDVWGNVPHVQVWEAIALSLDIDPKKVQVNQHGWMAGDGQYPHSEGKAFADRLEVLRRNLSTFQLHSIQMGRPDYCGIFVAEFARWALNIGWDIPEQLAALVQGGTQPLPISESTERDARPLATKERTTLLTIIAALARMAKLNYEDHPTKSADAISRETEQLGARIATRTIEEHLKAIPEALERRQSR